MRASLPHQPLRSLSTTGPSEEVHARLVLGRDRVIVGSCYLPPPAQVSPGLFVPCLQLRLPTIIGGDFNSHHEWWSSGAPNPAGHALREHMADVGMDISGLDQALATNPRSQGRPDLIVSSQVTECRSWVSEEHISDHFPLLTTYDLAWEFPAPPHDCRPRYQFAHANWDSFQRTVDHALDPRLGRLLQRIRDLDTPADRIQVIEQGASHLQTVLLDAAAELPICIREPGTPPFWNAACQAADDE